MARDRIARCVAAQVLRIVTILAFGGLLGETLVRMAPGYGVTEQELDSRLTQESIATIRQQYAGNGNILRYYRDYISGLAHGDLGQSVSLGRPVRELMAERLPVTIRSVAIGILCGWVLGFGLALSVTLARISFYDVFATILSGVFLCLPSAILALFFLFLGGPGPLAIGLIVFPRVFRYARNVLANAYALPHVLTARSKGLGNARILVWHVLPSAGPELLALAGVSVSLALGAAIPVEAICDSPGIGQLAWQAALGRDLPVLVNVTLLVTFVTLVANSSSDLIALLAGSPAHDASRDANGSVGVRA